MKFMFFSILALFFFTGCSKLSDTEKPKITITSPVQNDTIAGSISEVQMEFIATDNATLSTFILEITDNNGSSLFADSKQIYGSSYSYKNSFVVLKHPLKTKELTMIVHIVDEAKNETISSTTFYLAPAN